MTRAITLLIADDEIKFLNSIARRLELRGFDVTKAENGQEALDCASRGRFDLALIDLKMPGADGKQVLETLKKVNDFVEVIIMTGHGSAEAAAECLALGAFNYIPKPYELEKIIETLRQAYASRLKKQHLGKAELLKQIDEAAGLTDPVEALRAMSDLVE